jgi:MerR family transcriptional regulator, heat shock protein HspR
MSDPGRAVPPTTRPLGARLLPDENAPLFTVGQVAEMLTVQPAFLRRLDALEVVRPSRSGGGQRRYSRREMERIYALSGLIGEGLTLAGAQRIMLMQAEIDDLRRQIAELQQQQQHQQ